MYGNSVTSVRGEAVQMRAGSVWDLDVVGAAMQLWRELLHVGTGVQKRLAAHATATVVWEGNYRAACVADPL